MLPTTESETRTMASVIIIWRLPSQKEWTWRTSPSITAADCCTSSRWLISRNVEAPAGTPAASTSKRDRMTKRLIPFLLVLADYRNRRPSGGRFAVDSLTRPSNLVGACSREKETKLVTEDARVT